MDHAEPAQPINILDTFLEGKNTEAGENKGRHRNMKVGLWSRAFEDRIVGSVYSLIFNIYCVYYFRLILQQGSSS